MTIRIIVREVETGAACNVGGPVNVSHKTFDIDAPQLEAYLRVAQSYTTREVVGCELLEPTESVQRPGDHLPSGSNAT
jgi:hypothetical protein